MFETTSAYFSRLQWNLEMRSAEEREGVNAVSSAVLGAAIEVHRVMGPGLMESVYEECLRLELGLRGLKSARQVLTPLKYKGHDLHTSFRAGLIAEGCLLVEVKSVEKLVPIHDSQVLTYLKLTGLPVGLLLNFNETLLRNGIKRLANGF
jgi:GxxExxY protein